MEGDSLPQNGLLVVTAFWVGGTMSGVHDLPDALADLLDQRAGVLARSEALQAGMTRKQIQVKVASGRWQRLHPGVYPTFSGEPGRLPVLWAALLRAGPAAVLSYQTAAELNGFLAVRAPLIHVTVPSGCQVAGIPGGQTPLLRAGGRGAASGAGAAADADRGDRA